MLRDFDLEQMGSTRVLVDVDIDVMVSHEQVDRIEPSPPSPSSSSSLPVVPVVESKRWLMNPLSEWGWEELRDYVMGEIQSRQGAIPRNPLKEASIFKRFVKQWGDKAKPIAQYAFEVLDGMWAGAPVSVNRFCKGSDEFFAQEIARRLDEAVGVVSGRST